MKQISLSYEDFISIVSLKQILHQHIFKTKNDSNSVFKQYSLFAFDGNVEYSCNIDTLVSASFVDDYEKNWASIANKPLVAIDINSGLPKIKPTPIDGCLTMPIVYFTTGDENSLDIGQATNKDYWNIRYEYNDGDEFAYTTINFHADFNFYINGGTIRLVKIESGEITKAPKADIILAPQVPSSWGGNWYFVGNKQFFNVSDFFEIETDAKFIKYRSDFPIANHIELKVAHIPADRLRFEFYIRMFMS